MLRMFITLLTILLLLLMGSAFVQDGQRTAKRDMLNVEWKRFVRGNRVSEVLFTMENRSTVALLIVATQTPIPFSLGEMTPERSLWDGFSCCGRTYLTSLTRLPMLSITRVLPGDSISFSYVVDWHAESFVFELGMVSALHKERFDRVQKEAGVINYGAKASLIADIEAIEIWIRAGEDRGQSVFLVD